MDADLSTRIRKAFEAFIVLGIPAPEKLREAVVNYLVTGVAVAPWTLYEFGAVALVGKVPCSVFWALWYLHNKYPEYTVEREVRHITHQLIGITSRAHEP